MNEHSHDHGYQDLFGRRFYRISDYDQMAPFFMSIVGSGDCWLFISSTGGLTAGRVRPDSALFPYYTDDKVSEGAGRTGGLTLVRVTGGAPEPVLWEPFLAGQPTPSGTQRNLYKDITGTSLVFEEIRHDLGLRLRVTWQTGSRFGIVRSCELTNIGSGPTEVELVDGLVNLLPAGVGVDVQNRLSNLLDAYKRAEVDAAGGLGLFWLSSRLTDLAEPSESLHANVAWQVGLEDVEHLLSTRQLPSFRRGGVLVPEHDVRGQRGAYLVHSKLVLPAGKARTWDLVGDVAQDSAAAVDLRDLLRDPQALAELLAADIRETREELVAKLAAADGLQATGQEVASAHHLANVLFNIMRGGLPANGYHVSGVDFRAFVSQRSTATATRCAGLLGAIPDQLQIRELITGARASKEPDLIRLALEYLPLTFSRRHGDPSRPWNLFQIELQDGNGAPLLNYQGNWRDIFQNWEALAWSFPEYLESMVAVFIDATTADGYNPYRISRSGIDWEVPEPDNPWANIGYWSDHQIIYLLKLVEAAARFHPGRLAELLDQAVFTHADVPYRIASYEQTIADPFETITFDAERAAVIASRVQLRGADGRLVHGPGGDLVRVTLAEKLLLLLLAKLVNLVPDGGIWMNTQRPEWNDANNALVGRGLSVVTLAQLYRYLGFVRELIADDVHLSEELAELLTSVDAALRAHRGQLQRGFTDQTRRAFMDDLGAIGSRYRARVYSGFSGTTTTVTGEQIQALLSGASAFVESSLRANVRPDSLYHSYNLLELCGDGARIQRLPEMLEGQVAVLSSGLLSAGESLSLLQALRASQLYRADQHSYLLYPDKDLPGFLDRNVFPAARAAQCPVIANLVAAGDRSLVVADAHGDLHFAAGVRNAADVVAELDRLAADPRFAAPARESRDELLAIFEEVFNHSAFTGRSGSFFAYEGLGSIYWHMVSKLLLAVQETLQRADSEGEPAEVITALALAYEDIRLGLGYCKPATVYGAFPTDPYSHTPAGAGAKQPGMTGQVKEEVLTRLGELGLMVQSGQVVIRPIQLRPDEWLSAPTSFQYFDVAGKPATVDLPAGALAFTFCQVPVVYRRAEELDVQLQLSDGRSRVCPGGQVPADLSAELFGRTGVVARIDVRTPSAD